MLIIIMRFLICFFAIFKPSKTFNEILCVSWDLINLEFWIYHRLRLNMSIISGWLNWMLQIWFRNLVWISEFTYECFDLSRQRANIVAKLNRIYISMKVLRILFKFIVLISLLNYLTVSHQVHFLILLWYYSIYLFIFSQSYDWKFINFYDQFDIKQL